MAARAQPTDRPVTRALIGVAPADRLLTGFRLDASMGMGRPSRTAMVFAPDGRSIVFSAERNGRVQLYIRRLDQLEATAIAGTEGASNPFFSPNGESIGFYADGALKRISISGGAAVTVLTSISCTARAGAARIRSCTRPRAADSGSYQRRAGHACVGDQAHNPASSVIACLNSFPMGRRCCSRPRRPCFRPGRTPASSRTRLRPVSGRS